MQPWSRTATQNSVWEFTGRENEFTVGIEMDFVSLCGWEAVRKRKTEKHSRMKGRKKKKKKNCQLY